MASLNCVVLIGRLTRDMELKQISSGTSVGKFSIAVNKKYKKENQTIEEVSFFDCTCWGKIAEALAQYMLKGKLVAVEGELKQNRWEQDGQQRSKVEINVNNIQLLSFDPQSTTSPPPAQQDHPGFDDDIPF